MKVKLRDMPVFVFTSLLSTHLLDQILAAINA